MNTRIKRTGPVLKSRAEMESIIGEIRSLKINERKLVLDRDVAIQEIDERCGPHLSQIAKDIEQRVALVQAWAEANPEEFGARKSIDTAHGVIGFRTGTPKLNKVARQTWETVKQAVQQRFGFRFIRTREDLDKEGIIAALSAHAVTNEDLRQCGCEVVQEESFFVDPNLSDVETREKAVAA
jgi:phage host-nuclease inhibitor protein Gam